MNMNPFCVHFIRWHIGRINEKLVNFLGYLPRYIHTPTLSRDIAGDFEAHMSVIKLTADQPNAAWAVDLPLLIMGESYEA